MCLSNRMDSDLEYCRKIFAQSDYYHYLIGLFMPPEKRAALWTLGAFKNVIETIPSSVSDAALGYMRLTWWRDQIGLLAQGKLTAGQPVLASLKNHCHPCENRHLVEFINEHESIIENPGADFVSAEYPKLVQKILGADFARYQKLENKLTQILKKHHGTRWEHNPPFLAVRLWWSVILHQRKK